MKRALVIVAGLAVAAPAFAHHSFAADYFESQRITIEGELQRIDLRNPHSWVYVVARDENGQMIQYSGEWFSVTRLKSQGMTESTLKPGDHVVMTGAPGRDADAHRLHVKALARPADGWTWR